MGPWSDASSPLWLIRPAWKKVSRSSRACADRYETHHHLRIPDESIEQAVKLSARYVTERFLPDKAIDVMDEAGARVRLRRITPPPMVRDLQRKINEIVRLKKRRLRTRSLKKPSNCGIKRKTFVVRLTP